MSAEYITSNLKNNILTLTLNRPDLHNAFNEEVIALLTQKLKTADNDDNIRAVILAANGKNFCAGADLNWMRKMANYTYEENIADAKALAHLMQTLYELSKPTIALIQGAAYGGGAGLVACCDIAVACDTATFCFSETKLGLVPAVISPYVIRAIGERTAQRYFLTADVFDAYEAHRIGLLHAITNDVQLIETGNDIAENLSNNSPQALRETKKLLRKINNININDTVINQTIDCIANIRISTEGQEGVNAFLEKRKPTW